MQIVNSPLRVARTKYKDFILNLNNYRNTHYKTLNRVKINYKEVMKAQIEVLPTFKEINLVYTVYPKDRRKCDVANVCAVHDKFFSDALVELGKLPDDNYDYLKKITYQFGHVDKDNPRVEIAIIEQC